MKVINSVTTEWVECEVDVFDSDTLLPLDPSGDEVSMAFVNPGAKPADDDWHTASWSGTKRARILVGPDSGGVVLDVGDYSWWIRIVDNPEKVIQEVDTLRVE